MAPHYPCGSATFSTCPDSKPPSGTQLSNGPTSSRHNMRALTTLQKRWSRAKGNCWVAGVLSPVTAMNPKARGFITAASTFKWVCTSGILLYIRLLMLLPDVSYTRVPPTAKLHDTSSEDMHSSLFELSRLLLPDGRNIALSRPESAPEVSNELKQSTPPDNHFACFDVLYYASAHTSFEMFHDYSPTWRFVGQYLRFSQKAEDIAMGLVKHAFGLGSDQKMVPVSGKQMYCSTNA